MHSDIIGALTIAGEIRGAKGKTYSTISHFNKNSDQTFSIKAYSGDIETRGNITTVNGGNISSSGYIGAIGNITTSGGYMSAANGWSGNLAVSGNMSATGWINTSSSIFASDGWDGNLSVTGWIGATGNISTSNGYISASDGWSGNMSVTGDISCSGDINTGRYKTLNAYQGIFDSGNGTVKCGQITTASGTLAVRDNSGNKAIVDGIVYAVFG